MHLVDSSVCHTKQGDIVCQMYSHFMCAMTVCLTVVRFQSSEVTVDYFSMCAVVLWCNACFFWPVTQHMLCNSESSSSNIMVVFLIASHIYPSISLYHFFFTQIF